MLSVPEAVVVKDTDGRVTAYHAQPFDIAVFLPSQKAVPQENTVFSESKPLLSPDNVMHHGA
jgi:hypothetical protein